MDSAVFFTKESDKSYNSCSCHEDVWRRLYISSHNASGLGFESQIGQLFE